MESKSSTPANQGFTRAEMRRYHQMIGSRYEKDVTSCTCELPERPDNWSDDSWQKYKLIIARLPCKTCGWFGGSGFAMHHAPAGSFRAQGERSGCSVQPEEARGQSGSATDQHWDHDAGKPGYRVGCSHLLVHFDIRGLGLRFGPAKNDSEETNDILVVYEM